MSFKNITRKKYPLLLPLSWLYQIGVYVFSQMYDRNFLQSYKPPIASICVGNLSVGGTGKTPMIEYLLDLLDRDRCVAVVSRGYKRKTTGFVVADEHSTAKTIGDEPMLFYQKYQNTIIAVAEERVGAIQKLIEQKRGIDVFLLDDAYQHRAVEPGLTILLTDFSNIFTADWYLPAGSLRDLKSNYKRADIIIVTKCDEALNEKGRIQLTNEIKPLKHQKIFFTKLEYGLPYNIFNNATTNIIIEEWILLVTGIANPSPILALLNQKNKRFDHISFPDHYQFSEQDVRDIVLKFQSNQNKKKIILTTEKDATRLKDFRQLSELPVFAFPVKHAFLFNDRDNFDRQIQFYLNQTNNNIHTPN